jgi:hypothetical protein
MPRFIVEGDGEYPFDTESFKLKEQIDLERVTGEKIDVIVANFNGWDNPRGTRGGLGIAAFLWLCMRRAGHSVDYGRMIEEIDVTKVRIEWEETEAVPDPPEEPPAKPRRGGASARKTAAGSPKK